MPQNAKLSERDGFNVNEKPRQFRPCMQEEGYKRAVALSHCHKAQQHSSKSGSDLAKALDKLLGHGPLVLRKKL